MNLLLRPAAVADLHAARKYYEEARPVLGEELADDLDHLFARLLAFPLSAPTVAGYEPVRRPRLRRFPYQVFYRADDERIDILRIVHTARAPETWRTATRQLSDQPVTDGRELIHKDQDRQQLRDLLLAGARSVPAARTDAAYFDPLGGRIRPTSR